MWSQREAVHDFDAMKISCDAEADALSITFREATRSFPGDSTVLDVNPDRLHPTNPSRKARAGHAHGSRHGAR